MCPSGSGTALSLVADRDKVLSLEAVGFADVAARKPMRADTLFWIASQSKPITGTALMMLVDEGKVRVNDPVEAYLPEFKDQWLAVEQDANHILLRKPRHPITIHNVLTHTSGMPFKSEAEEPTRDRLPLRTAIRTYAMTPLQFEPDTKYQYSNAGINTAGGLFSTVADVARFCQMTLNGGVFAGKRYLSEAAVHEMTRKQTGAGVPEGYGFGWGTDGTTFGHGGAFATNMSIDPKRGLVLVFLVQHAGFPGNGDQSHAAFKAAAETAFGYSL